MTIARKYKITEEHKRKISDALHNKKNNTKEPLKVFLQKSSLKEFLKKGKENNYYEQEE